MFFFGFLALPRKRWFRRQKLTFTWQKGSFPEADQAKTIFLQRKSWFVYEKPSFCEAKPKKPSFSTSTLHSLKKIVFLVLWFCLVKDGFGDKNQLFPRKKMVFLRQTRPKPSFYGGKVGLSMKNHLFSRQNQKKTTFSTSTPHSLKKMFFFGFLALPRKRWFRRQKLTFTWQKGSFPEADQAKTIFLRGKSWFVYEKPSFYEAKPKKNIFFNIHPPFSQKDVFFWFFGFASSFSRAGTVQV